MTKQEIKKQKTSWFSMLKNFFTGYEAEDTDSMVSRIASSVSTLPGKGLVEDLDITLPSHVNKIEFVHALLRMGPEDLDYLYFDGQCDNSIPLRQMAYKIALQSFQNLPDDPALLNRLGFSLIELADYERALTCFLRESEKSENDGAVWNNIAWCQMRLGRYHEALVSGERALKFLSDHAYVHHDYAAILAGLGRLDEAVKVIKNAMNLKPQAIQLNYLLASLLERKGDTIKSAIAYWKQYLELADGKTGHEKAILRAQDNLRKYGVKVSLRITQKPEMDKQMSLFNNLALSHMLCLTQYMQLVKEDPRKISLEERIEAGKAMEHILQPYNDTVDNLSQRPGRLSERYREILARHYSFLALANLLQEKLAGVEDWLKKSIALDKSSQEPQAFLYAYYVIKVMHGVKEDEEYKLIQAALKIDPRPGHAHILLARHYCFKKEYKQIEEIVAQINKASITSEGADEYELALLEEAKFGVTLWKAVGRILDNKDNEALIIIDGLRQKRPDSPELKYWLVIINIRKGSYSKAKEILKTIPPEVIPEETLSQLRNILYYRPVRISGSDFDIDAFNIRSPIMTGCTSSPLVSRS